MNVKEKVILNIPGETHIYMEYIWKSFPEETLYEKNITESGFNYEIEEYEKEEFKKAWMDCLVLQAETVVSDICVVGM